MQWKHQLAYFKVNVSNNHQQISWMGGISSVLKFSDLFSVFKSCGPEVVQATNGSHTTLQLNRLGWFHQLFSLFDFEFLLAVNEEARRRL